MSESIREAVPSELLSDTRVHASCTQKVLLALLFPAVATLVTVFLCVAASVPIPLSIVMGVVSASAVTTTANRWLRLQRDRLYDENDPPSVELDGETLTFRWGAHCHTSRYADCRLRQGDASRARFGKTRIAMLPGYRAILISMPPFGYGASPFLCNMRRARWI